MTNEISQSRRQVQQLLGPATRQIQLIASGFIVFGKVMWSNCWLVGLRQDDQRFLKIISNTQLHKYEARSYRST